MRNFWFKRAEKYYQKNKFHLVADISFLVIILLLIVSLAAIRNWRPPSLVVFETKIISGDVLSGGEVEFTIDYQTKKDLKNNTMSFNWPDNFVLESVDSGADFNNQTNILSLGDLSKGEKGEIRIKGRVYGAVEERQDLFFFYNCDLCQNGQVESLFYNIKDSLLSLSAPEFSNVYRDVEFPLAVVLENKSTAEFKDINLRFNTDWQIIAGDTKVAVLAPGEKKEIVLTLISKTAVKRPELKLSWISQGLLQGELIRAVLLSEPNLKLALMPENKVVVNNQAVAYILNYENNEKIAIDNLRFSFSGANSTTIQPSDIAVGHLAVGAKGSARLAVDFPNTPGFNRQLTVNVRADYNLSGRNLSYSVTAVPVKVISDLKINSGAYYYSPQGDQLGVGPLPPQVGLPTNYWIFLTVDNTGNQLDNFVATADLPPGVVFSGRKTLSIGTWSYNEVSSRFNWEIEKVDQDANPNDYRLGFEVNILPEPKDVGQILPLLQNIKYQAQDAFVEQKISGVLPSLDTNLSADFLGRGRGRVIDFE